MRPPKQVSIEYAHIYTNNHISEEQSLSLAILKELSQTYARDRSSLVVLIDDYSFPDPTFNYHGFQGWLKEQGFRPDVMARESQLIPLCDHIINALEKPAIRDQICDYVRAKKYPCSLFIAAWYLLRLGYIPSLLFPSELTSERLINILPTSFQPFEEKALEIIRATPFRDAADKIDYRYHEGRLVA